MKVDMLLNKRNQTKPTSHLTCKSEVFQNLVLHGCHENLKLLKAICSFDFCVTRPCTGYFKKFNNICDIQCILEKLISFHN